MANKIWIGADGAYGTNANWSPTNVPTAGDDVRLIADRGGNISSGLDQSAVALGDFICEEGFDSTVGSNTGYLQIDPDLFEWSGTGKAFIDIGSANIPVQVFNAARASTGERGLYLKGSDITILNVVKGAVGLACRHGETSTADNARFSGSAADLWLGAGVTLTTLEGWAGVCRARCSGTTINLYGGTLTLEEAGAWTTVNVYGGTLYPNATGTIATVNVYGGTVDWTKSSAARTVSDLNLKRGTSWRVLLNKEVVTYTAIDVDDSMFLSGGTLQLG